MYKNTIAANKIGMEVFNFKVENLHKGIQLFQANFINKSIFAILELQLIVDTVATTAAPTIRAAPMATLAQLGRDQEPASSLLLTGSFIQ